MSTSDDPVSSRIRLVRHGDDLSVTIKSVSHVYVTLILCAWLVIWVSGLYMIFITLASGKDFVFAVLWLLVWLAGGAGVILFALWNFFGKELIEIRKNVMQITRKVPFWTRKRVYLLEQVKNMRLDRNLERELFTNQVPPPSIFSRMSQGSVKFNYGTKKIGFGLELDPVEAGQLASIVRKTVVHNRS